MKLSKLIKEDFFVLFLLFLLFSAVNIFWIIRYAPEMSNEDTLVLNPSLSLLKGDFGYFFSMYQPIIPLIMSFFLSIFPFESTPLFVNLLFSIPLILFTYFTSKKLFGKKYGILASFLVITFPATIAYSRTVYDTFILMSILSASIYFFIMSDFFSSLKYTIFFTIASVFGLLSRYTMTSYIGSFFLFFFLFKMYDFIRKKRNLIKIFETKSFKNAALSLMTILIVVTPLYVNNLDIQSFFNRDSEFSEIIHSSGKNIFLCDTLNYPLYLFNYQIGFFVSLIFASALIFFVIKYDKIDKNLFLLIFIIGINFLFYSYFVDIKHPTITGISLSLIAIFLVGFLKNIYIKNNFLAKIIVFLLILNGLFFISPLQLPDKINNLSFLNKTINSIDCRIKVVEYKVNEDYKFLNKDIRLQKYDLLKYRKRQKLMTNISSRINTKYQNRVEVLDLTTYFHYELKYYMYIEKDHFLGYYNCNDFQSKLSEVDYVLVSEQSFNELDNPWRLYFTEEEISICDEIREEVLDSWEKISSWKYEEKIYPLDEIHLYKSPLID